MSLLGEKRRGRKQMLKHVQSWLPSQSLYQIGESFSYTYLQSDVVTYNDYNMLFCYKGLTIWRGINQNTNT